MKKQFACLLTTIGIMGMFTSCSSDDDPVVPGSSIEGKTYTGMEGLAFNVDGISTVGQTVTFEPGQNGSATITIKGEPLDINSVIGGIMPSVSKAESSALAFPTASVIPGSTEVAIPVTLTGDGNNASFAGTHETEYCTFSYSGQVSNNDMKLNLNDIKLKNTSMAGTYKASDDIFDEDMMGDPQLNLWKVARVEWVSSKGIDMGFGFEIPMSSILGMTLNMTTLPGPDGEKQQLPTLLNTILKSVTLGEDGSVTARYADTGKDGWPLTDSPKGFARYVVKDDNTLLLFLNPAAIIANTVNNVSKASRAIDVNALMEGLITTVVPMLRNGVPVKYGKVITDQEGTLDENPNAVSFYLGTETLLPILKIAVPVLTDKDVVDAIVEAAKKDPDMGSMAGMLPVIFEQLPDVIDTTTKVEIGINLYK